MVISQVPWLASLPQPLLVELSSQLVSRDFQEDETIFLHGDQGSELFFIQQGAIRICRSTAEGREVTLAIRGQGQFVGDMALLDGGCRSASGFAHGGPCRCQVLSAQSFRAVIKKSPEAALSLLAYLSRRLREASDRMEELVVRTVRQRLAGALAGVATREGAQQADGSILLPKWVGIASLIGLLGTVRESASRATRDLCGEGLIRKKGRRFVVVDLEGLWTVALE